MPEPTAVDLLIEPRWIIPIEPAGITLEGHALAVDKGRIVGLPPVAEATKMFQPKERLALPEHVLIPGLVNLHTHAAMTLLRGYADDLPLMRWLEDHIWPAEGRLVSPAFVRDGTLLASWEMLRGGITCFNDMYFFPESAAEAAIQSGIRAALGITVIEFPTVYAADPSDYLAKGLAARDALSNEPLVSFCLAPHAPYTVSDRTFERIAVLSAQLDLPVHIHIHETRSEIEGSLKQYGVRPLARLARTGLLNPSLIGVHAVHLEPDEISQLAEQGCHIAHCPSSNMKLGSGIAPVARWAERNIGVGLGSDGAASNNRLDLFREMRHAALLAKVATEDATAVPANAVLAMATLEGAKALGLDHEIGSLLPGKAADMCAVRLDDWAIQPCFDPASHLVYAAGREHVSHTWVAGRLRITDGNPVDFDPAHLIETARLWHTKLRS